MVKKSTNHWGEKISDNRRTGFRFRQRDVKSLDESSASSLVKIVRPVGGADNQDPLFTSVGGAVLKP